MGISGGKTVEVRQVGVGGLAFFEECDGIGELVSRRRAAVFEKLMNHL